MTNVARIIIARSSKSVETGNDNMKIENLTKELERNYLKLKIEDGNVMIYDCTKDATTDHLSIFFFDRNDFLVNKEYFSDGIRINTL